MKVWTTIALASVAALGCAQAEETCVRNCVEIYKPVCGSDGKTYSNECVFNYNKCSSNNTALTIAAQGECGSSSGSAGSSVCETSCTKIYKPVCGSDGKTYSNECLLNNAKCKTPALTLAAQGACSSSSSSGDTVCEQNCTDQYEPVCGSDGKTYSNECRLEVAQCESPSLTKASDGACTRVSKSGSVGSTGSTGSTSADTSNDATSAPKSTVPAPSPTSSGTSVATQVAASAIVALAATFLL